MRNIEGGPLDPRSGLSRISSAIHSIEVDNLRQQITDLTRTHASFQAQLVDAKSSAVIAGNDAKTAIERTSVLASFSSRLIELENKLDRIAAALERANIIVSE